MLRNSKTRRNHAYRIKAKRIRQAKELGWSLNPKAIGIYANHSLGLCSSSVCLACRNPHKIYGNGKAGKSHAELIADARTQNQIDELKTFDVDLENLPNY